MISDQIRRAVCSGGDSVSGAEEFARKSVVVIGISVDGEHHRMLP
jgi:hypothetical protein